MVSGIFAAIQGGHVGLGSRVITLSTLDKLLYAAAEAAAFMGKVGE
jgi:hypothetical protein